MFEHKISQKQFYFIIRGDRRLISNLGVRDTYNVMLVITDFMSKNYFLLVFHSLHNLISMMDNNE